MKDDEAVGEEIKPQIRKLKRRSYWIERKMDRMKGYK